MPKGFQNKLCVYCLVRQSTATGDHVFARNFFVEQRRANLPKVPACIECNNLKSRLEHYLGTVLPFGGRHDDSHAILNMIEGRLARNTRLHRELSQGREQLLVEENPGKLQPALAVPFNGDILNQFGAFAVKGLLYHHWGVVLGVEHDLRVISLTSTGAALFDAFFNANPKQRVNEDVGNNTFRYEGIQIADYPELTMWKISVYGGLRVSGDTDVGSVETTTTLCALTATKEFLQRPAISAIFG